MNELCAISHFIFTTKPKIAYVYRQAKQNKNLIRYLYIWLFYLSILSYIYITTKSNSSSLFMFKMLCVVIWKSAAEFYNSKCRNHHKY